KINESLYLIERPVTEYEKSDLAPELCPNLSKSLVSMQQYYTSGSIESSYIPKKIFLGNLYAIYLNKSWHRAVVTEILNDCCEQKYLLFLLDFKAFEIVSIKDLRHLTDNFKQIPCSVKLLEISNFLTEKNQYQKNLSEPKIVEPNSINCYQQPKNYMFANLYGDHQKIYVKIKNESQFNIEGELFYCSDTQKNQVSLEHLNINTITNKSFDSEENFNNDVKDSLGDDLEIIFPKTLYDLKTANEYKMSLVVNSTRRLIPDYRAIDNFPKFISKILKKNMVSIFMTTAQMFFTEMCILKSNIILVSRQKSGKTLGYLNQIFNFLTEESNIISFKLDNDEQKIYAKFIIVVDSKKNGLLINQYCANIFGRNGMVKYKFLNGSNISSIEIEKLLNTKLGILVMTLDAAEILLNFKTVKFQGVKTIVFDNLDQYDEKYEKTISNLTVSGTKNQANYLIVSAHYSKKVKIFVERNFLDLSQLTAVILPPESQVIFKEAMVDLRYSDGYDFSKNIDKYFKNYQFENLCIVGSNNLILDNISKTLDNLSINHVKILESYKESVEQDLLQRNKNINNKNTNIVILNDKLMDYYKLDSFDAIYSVDLGDSRSEWVNRFNLGHKYITESSEKYLFLQFFNNDLLSEIDDDLFEYFNQCNLHDGNDYSLLKFAKSNIFGLSSDPLCSAHLIYSNCIYAGECIFRHSLSIRDIYGHDDFKIFSEKENLIKSFEGKITNVVFSNTFYIQISKIIYISGQEQDFKADIDSITIKMNEYYCEFDEKIRVEECDVQQGNLYTFEETSGNFIRVFVVKKRPDGKIVLYSIDFGFQFLSEGDNLFYLPHHFKNVDHLAVKVTVPNLKPISKSDTHSILSQKKFLECLLDKQTICEFDYMLDNIIFCTQVSISKNSSLYTNEENLVKLDEYLTKNGLDSMNNSKNCLKTTILQFKLENDKNKIEIDDNKFDNQDKGIALNSSEKQSIFDNKNCTVDNKAKTIYQEDSNCTKTHPSRRLRQRLVQKQSLFDQINIRWGQADKLLRVGVKLSASGKCSVECSEDLQTIFLKISDESMELTKFIKIKLFRKIYLDSFREVGKMDNGVYYFCFIKVDDDLWIDLIDNSYEIDKNVVIFTDGDFYADFAPNSDSEDDMVDWDRYRSDNGKKQSQNRYLAPDSSSESELDQAESDTGSENEYDYQTYKDCRLFNVNL
ncbi:MAG: hypothetical protein MHPSP_000994, partial [Paramarteilia canceri]